MKYRNLTVEELQSLEQEFVHYLVINSITADDWVKIKEYEPEKAGRIIELFSDSVFDKILLDVKYLDYRGKKELYSYQCLEDKIVVVGVYLPINSKIDFADPEFMHLLAEAADEDLKVFYAEKPYAEQREQEIFKMLDQGCEISEGALFKQLCLIL